MKMAVDLHVTRYGEKCFGHSDADYARIRDKFTRARSGAIETMRNE